MLPAGGLPAGVVVGQAGAAWLPLHGSRAQHLQRWMKRLGCSDLSAGRLLALKGRWQCSTCPAVRPSGDGAIGWMQQSSPRQSAARQLLGL